MMGGPDRESVLLNSVDDFEVVIRGSTVSLSFSIEDAKLGELAKAEELARAEGMAKAEELAKKAVETDR